MLLSSPKGLLLPQNLGSAAQDQRQEQGFSPARLPPISGKSRKNTTDVDNITRSNAQNSEKISSLIGQSIVLPATGGSVHGKES